MKDKCLTRKEIIDYLVQEQKYSKDFLEKEDINTIYDLYELYHEDEYDYE